MSGAASDSEVPWLDAGQLEDWKALVALLMTLPAALDGQLRRDSELNIFEYQVLAALSGAPARTIAMSELALLSQGSLSRLSHAVTRLERDGAVERRVCSSAGRRIEVRLTDLGVAGHPARRLPGTCARRAGWWWTRSPPSSCATSARQPAPWLLPPTRAWPRGWWQTRADRLRAHSWRRSALAWIASCTYCARPGATSS